MCSLKTHKLYNYRTYKGANYKQLSTSYEVFGREILSAPIVLVNHALTGNTDVKSKEKGWWKEIVGDDKLIDTKTYTVIVFNIPGNGSDGVLIDDYKDFTARDIANIFYTVLNELKIKKVYAIIGGSLGGGIAWEMACLYPSFAKYIIPIATNYQSSDWVIAHSYIQESILINSKKPLEDARKMAMLLYRTPLSFAKKFDRTKVEDNSVYKVESWLNHHGGILRKRFDIKAYLMMNHLLSTINIVYKGKTIEETFKKIESTIIQISINSDLFFVAEENIKTKKILDELQIVNQYHEIKSIDGHDAFLIEHEQITEFLKPIFTKHN
ncbi:MAG: alpha/beta fold hydrolase [Flavobacteriaceae bacterium]|nr:alpha/beta fold hydrolase [Flavobacteriaceae bacterium]